MTAIAAMTEADDLAFVRLLADAAIPGPAGRDPPRPRQLSPAPSPNPDTRDGSRAAVLP